MPCDLEIAGEEDGEARVVEEIQHGEDAGCDYGALFDHSEGHEGDFGVFGIPEEEEADDEDANDEHGDVGALIPSLTVSSAGQREGDEREAKADGEEDGAEDVEINPRNPRKTLHQRLRLVGGAPRALLVIPILRRPALQDEERDDQRRGAEGDDDGPHPVPPAPGRVLEHTVREDGSQVESGNGGDGFREGGPEAPVEEAGCVGDEDLLEDGVACVADGFEDAAGLAVLGFGRDRGGGLRCRLRCYGWRRRGCGR